MRTEPTDRRSGWRGKTSVKLTVALAALVTALGLVSACSSSHEAGAPAGKKLSMASILHATSKDSAIPKTCARVLGSPAYVANQLGVDRKLFTRSYSDNTKLDCGYDLEPDNLSDSTFDIQVGRVGVLPRADGSNPLYVTVDGTSAGVLRGDVAQSRQAAVHAWMLRVAASVTK